jgi:hypothetical protein
MSQSAACFCAFTQMRATISVDSQLRCRGLRGRTLVGVEVDIGATVNICGVSEVRLREVGALSLLSSPTCSSTAYTGIGGEVCKVLEVEATCLLVIQSQRSSWIHDLHEIA